MLCTGVRSLFCPPSTPTPTPTPTPTHTHTPRNLSITTTKHLSLLRNNRRNLSSSRIRMSASASREVIEHIVLFNVKESTEPTKINSMVDGLNGLKALPMVIHLTAGPIHRIQCSALKFTHMLHSRYQTKDDLANYSAHQDHISVVRESVLPICEDLMAVDWVAQSLEGPITPPPGSAMRLQLLKLKEGVGEIEKEQAINGMKEKLGGANQMSFGENFSPARAKGFSIASVGFFSGLNELDAADGNEEKEKVRDYVDGMLVIDYAIPVAKSASAI